MARNENPPFERGATAYNGDTIDSANLVGEQWEGQEWVFEDVDPNTGLERTERFVRLRVVRNVATIALVGKRLAQFDTTAGKYGARIAGYAATTAGEGYPIDEYLPTAGVPINDLCYIVIEGPAVIANATGAANANFGTAAGVWGVAETAAGSTNTTAAGRIAVQDFATGATGATLANQVQNRVGRNLTGATTADTQADVLFDVGHW